MRSNGRSSIVVAAVVLSLGLWLAPTVQAAQPVHPSPEGTVDVVDSGFIGWMDWILDSLQSLVFSSDSAATSTSECTDCTADDDTDSTTNGGGGDNSGPDTTTDGLGGIDVNG